MITLKFQFFKGLATYVSVFLISKVTNEILNYKLIDSEFEIPEKFEKFEFTMLSDEQWDFNSNQGLKEKIFNGKLKLNDISQFTYGVITGLDKAFLIPTNLVEELKLEKEITRNFIRPQNYKKYCIHSQTYSIIYPYNTDNSILDEVEFKNKYPNCYNYLSSLKVELENRQDSRTTIKEKGIAWYSLMRKVDLNEINTEKIVFYDVGMLPNFGIDNQDFIFGGGTSHSLRITDLTFDIRFITGLLNSTLMTYIIYDICPVKMGNARKYGLDYIKKLPIIKVDTTFQKPIIKLVDKILSLKKSNPDADTSDLEAEIDKLVYELYGLSEEEIEVIEK